MVDNLPPCMVVVSVLFPMIRCKYRSSMSCSPSLSLYSVSVVPPSIVPPATTVTVTPLLRYPQVCFYPCILKILENVGELSLVYRGDGTFGFENTDPLPLVDPRSRQGFEDVRALSLVYHDDGAVGFENTDPLPFIDCQNHEGFEDAGELSLVYRGDGAGGFENTDPLDLVD